jgi:hypothetical protein
MRRQLMRLALENAFINVNQPPSHEDALIMSFRKEFGHLYPSPPVVIEHNPIGRPYLAMEEIANGQPVNEIEHTIYARVVNFSDLEQAASKENQEQWEIRIEKTEKIAGKGSMRVRKTWLDGKEEEASFVRTSKVVMNEKGDKIELPMPSNKDEFTIFKFLAAQGMRKVRYTFPIIGTNLKWEIDMFPKPDGDGFFEWCKIDLEVQNREQPIPEFPIPLEDVILPEGYGRTGGGEVQNQITQLYDQFFLLKNQFLPRGDAAPAVGSTSAGDQGIATAVPALPNDTAEPQQLDTHTSASDEAPAPAVQDIAPRPAASTAQNPQQQLDQALNQGIPDNLQVQPEPEVQEPVTAELPQQAQAEEPPQVDSTVAQTPAPNEAPAQAEQPEAEAAQAEGTPLEQPEQPDVSAPSDTPDELATKPQAGNEAPVEDNSSTASTPEEQQEQQEEQTQEQTEDKVEAIQQQKKAEAESQGKLDPTEDGKVPVDLIDNPAGDPSMMKPDDQDNPEGAGEETANGGNVTGATDGTNPDENGAGTGDGLGGELADGAGTTGTDDDALDLTSADATDPASEEGTVPTSTSGTAEGNNGSGEDIDQANGEQAGVANVPSKAETDEIPPENDQDKRKLEAQAQ